MEDMNNGLNNGMNTGSNASETTGTTYTTGQTNGTTYTEGTTAGSTYAGEASTGTTYTERASEGTYGSYTYGQGSAAQAGSYSGGTYDYSTSFNAKKENRQARRARRQERRDRKPGNSGVKKVFSTIAMGLVFGLVAGLAFYGVNQVTGTRMALTEETAETTVAEVPTLDTTLNDKGVVTATTSSNTSAVVTDVTNVVDNAMPSIVSIVNNYTSTAYSFFGQQYTQEGQASGTGIIVGQNDTELLIVTNYHVIENNKSLQVTFNDASIADALVKGTDSDMDLAVIAVKLEDLSSDTMSKIAIAVLGDSDALKVGEPAIAIGNALGYGQSVTTGVISAVDRAFTSTDEYGNVVTDESRTFIQTDAAINPGNSGGALLNINGEVIGINSNKIGGTTVEGMGYAIPISAALPIINDLMQQETLTKVEEAKAGYLGITGQTVDSETASSYNIPEGVYVTQVYQGTGAEAAGLIRGDIIVAINGKEVNSMEALKEALSYHAAGETVTLTISQAYPTGYQTKDVQVTLSERPSSAQ
ncbi:MAG: trypsin-like peptidase domain-containing protein [Lachnospiraceae bacterium]|nr:trypsin-like peptidase domain-containing protein [Lachnospiraceae bacterium]